MRSKTPALLLFSVKIVTKPYVSRLFPRSHEPGAFDKTHRLQAADALNGLTKNFSRQKIFTKPEKFFTKPLEVFTICLKVFITNFVTHIQNFRTYIQKC